MGLPTVQHFIATFVDSMPTTSYMYAGLVRVLYITQMKA